MIKFDNYYYISEDDVVAIEKGKDGSNTHPFTLSVRTRDGKLYSVNYAYEIDRNRVADDMARQVERETIGRRASTLADIYNKLYLIDDCVRRVDKRGLRIWRQLKDLLGVKVEE